jgi:hypothetical protein
MSTDGEREEAQGTAAAGADEGNRVAAGGEGRDQEEGVSGQPLEEAPQKEEELDLKSAVKVLLADRERMTKFMESFDVPAEEDVSLPAQEQQPVQQPAQQQMQMPQFPVGTPLVMTPYGPMPMQSMPGQGMDLQQQVELSPEQMQIQRMERQLSQMKAVQIKTQIESMRRNTTRYPDFRRAEAEMAGLLNTYPSMAEDMERLYKAAGGRVVEPKRPEQVRQAVRATAAATKPRVAPVASVGKKSFDQTVDEAYDRIMGGGQ